MSINTMRTGKVEAVIELPNLYVFMYTKEWTGEYIVISVRTEVHEDFARQQAASIYSDTFLQDGLDWKDEYQAFIERAKLVEFVDANYFNKFRNGHVDGIDATNSDFGISSYEA